MTPVHKTNTIKGRKVPTEKYITIGYLFSLKIKLYPKPSPEIL